MFSFFSWLRRPARPQVEPLAFTFYTRQGCHLCDDAWDLLSQEQRHWNFRLEKIDVDADPELQSLYGQEVPVVAVNGKVRFRGIVNKILLHRLLEAETRRH